MALAVLFATVLVACEDNAPINKPPEARQPIAPVTMLPDEPTQTIRLQEYFSDPDESDTLTYTAQSGDPTIATVTVRGALLTITAIGPGTATITVTATDPDQASIAQSFDVTVPDTQPSFGAQTATDQTYTVGTAITPLLLPAATGGNGSLTYSLTPTVPGLQFEAAGRTLQGTPSAAGTYAMTYRVVDSENADATLRFTITVELADSADTELSFGGQTVSDLVFTFGPETEQPEFSLVLPAATGTHGRVRYWLYLSESGSVFDTMRLDGIGLEFDAERRLLHGTPAGYAGTHEITYGVRDDRGEGPTLTFNITIALEQGPKFYWVHGFGYADLVIWRSNLYGSGTGRVFESVGAYEYGDDDHWTGHQHQLALDLVSEVLYWVELDRGVGKSRILRAGMLDGSNREVLAEESHALIHAIALGGDQIYWSLAVEDRQGEISCPNTAQLPLLKRSNLDGSNVEILVRRNSYPANKDPHSGCYRGYAQEMDLDLASGHIFWTTDLTPTTGELYVANIDGSDVSKWPDSPAMTDIAVDTSTRKLYWRGKDWLVGRANYDGSSMEELVGGGQSRGFHHEQIALDVPRGKMYFANTAAVGVSTLMRANLDGTQVEEIVPEQYLPGQYTNHLFSFETPFALDIRDDAP